MEGAANSRAWSDEVWVMLADLVIKNKLHCRGGKDAKLIKWNVVKDRLDEVFQGSSNVIQSATDIQQRMDHLLNTTFHNIFKSVDEIGILSARDISACKILLDQQARIQSCDRRRVEAIQQQVSDFDLNPVMRRLQSRSDSDSDLADPSTVVLTLTATAGSSSSLGIPSSSRSKVSRRPRVESIRSSDSSSSSSTMSASFVMSSSSDSDGESESESDQEEVRPTKTRKTACRSNPFASPATEIVESTTAAPREQRRLLREQITIAEELHQAAAHNEKVLLAQLIALRKIEASLVA